MKEQLIINGNAFKIEGKWSINGMNNCYMGTATKIIDNQEFPIDCKIPLSAIKKYGKELFEEDIEKSLIEFLSINR